MILLRKLHRYMMRRPIVRPWALAAPILVLLVCLPMLRPVRHPDPRSISNDELARLATVQSLVEHHSLALTDPFDIPQGNLIQLGESIYSDQPPVMALLLSGPYWVMSRWCGITFEDNPTLVAYILTLLGTTLPVALGAGLIYRMSRLFELRRPVRMLMAVAVVFGSGLVSYAVVLNAHAPAAVLVLAAAACLIRVIVSERPSIGGGWIVAAGLGAGLALVIEPTAGIFTLLLAAVPVAMRWRLSLKIGGLLLYLIGLTPPLFLHAALMTTEPITGDLLPGMFHPELALSVPRMPMPLPISEPLTIVLPGETEDFTGPTRTSWMAPVWRTIEPLLAALIGPHGLFSHFPILVFGLAGVAAIMHRHWPMATKVLAAATVAGAAIAILILSFATPAGTGSMFAARWFIVFLPLLLFWAGAWVRKPHTIGSWTIAGVFLAFSITVTMLGATDPFPRGGYEHYTVAEALARLRHHPQPTPPMLAGSTGQTLP